MTPPFQIAWNTLAIHQCWFSSGTEFCCDADRFARSRLHGEVVMYVRYLQVTSHTSGKIPHSSYLQTITRSCPKVGGTILTPMEQAELTYFWIRRIMWNGGEETTDTSTHTCQLFSWNSCRGNRKWDFFFKRQATADSACLHARYFSFDQVLDNTHARRVLLSRGNIKHLPRRSLVAKQWRHCTCTRDSMCNKGN